MWNDISIYQFQKSISIEVETSNKSTDTDDLVIVEPSIAFAEQDVETEQKSSRRIKRETKPRRRTRKAKQIDEGNRMMKVC